jgi:predicted  nucleic acid-binding Zn-ribbon protein
MDELNNLITQAVACVDSMKLAADNYVERLLWMREQSLKCDEDLRKKQWAADQHIASLNSQIEELKEGKVNLERELRGLRNQIAQEKGQIGKAKREFRKLIEQIEAKQRVA